MFISSCPVFPILKTRTLYFPNSRAPCPRLKNVGKSLCWKHYMLLLNKAFQTLSILKVRLSSCQVILLFEGVSHSFIQLRDMIYNILNYTYIQNHQLYNLLFAGAVAWSDMRPRVCLVCGRSQFRSSCLATFFSRVCQEIISTAILSFLLIQEGQLSVTGKRMCTKYR